MTPLALVGLPGSGKTTIGKHLARRLGLPFVDLDTRIEQELGCSIRAYFEAQGEAAFREVESSTLARLAGEGPSVLSTGGGIVLLPQNREVLRRQCRVVYLRASPEDLFQRLRHDRKRPLLQVADPLERLRSLHAQRAPLYEEVAEVTVEAGRERVQPVVEAILSQLGPATPGA
ncbi:shikimate kinase [Ramlibacter rhizophilus]|uniref:Shikimate kinase n=1 Tax=Ramlibacter rhizophilus TaxID=1781167 RepID=A0A4Z0BJW0_9BURK|nr:shikimate kinase [Ramlibacter rhizophilus]TFY99605.1 shikimate kinase [Ramlibacter rhizophilus]